MKHTIWACLISLIAGWTVCRADTAKPNTTKADVKWFDVTGMGEEVFEQKKEIVLSPQKAVEIFKKEFPRLNDNWKEKLGQPIEDAPAARHLSDLPDKVKAMGVRRDGKPYAAVQAFSKNHLKVMVLKDRGQYLWHRHYECLAAFMIPRTSVTDEIFDAKTLDLLYATKIKGIGYGASMDDVSRSLGKPDLVESYQAVGMYRYSYFKEDVTILFEYFDVKTISRGVPASVKQEAQEKGSHIVRY